MFSHEGSLYPFVPKYESSKAMSLVVDKINCVEESDEIGADDIYLVVFQGRSVAPFASGLKSIGPGSAWQDFASVGFSWR